MYWTLWQLHNSYDRPSLVFSSFFYCILFSTSWTINLSWSISSLASTLQYSSWSSSWHPFKIRPTSHNGKIWRNLAMQSPSLALSIIYYVQFSVSTPTESLKRLNSIIIQPWELIFKITKEMCQLHLLITNKIKQIKLNLMSIMEILITMIKRGITIMEHFRFLKVKEYVLDDLYKLIYQFFS